jgi:hypothetical protein
MLHLSPQEPSPKTTPMALSVDFAIDEKLQLALTAMKGDAKIRSAIAVIESERIQLYKDTLAASANIADDMADVRKAISDGKIEACFVVVRVDETSFGQIMLVPEGSKPKTRMIYASSSAHLRKESGLAISTDTHASSVDEVTAKLFGHDTAESKRELMNEKEKEQESIAKMPVAPAPTAMAGVGCPLSEEATKAVADFNDKKLMAITLAVNPKNIDLDKTIPAEGKLADVVAAIPDNTPRFIVVWFQEKVFLAYIVPPTAKPKERMPYASTKASLLSQLDANKCKVEKRVEIDEAKEMEESMKEALEVCDLKDDVKPVAPKAPLGVKGPRMLM